MTLENDDDDDPFACFDDDDDDAESNNSDDNNNEKNENENKYKLKAQEKEEEPKKRDTNCGILSFHPNTESSLLIHVQNAVTNSGSDDNTATTSSQKVRKAIDKFCNDRHWMMHVGPEKATIVSDALRTCVDSYLERNNRLSTHNNHNHKNQNFVCVELGTYCGYASLVLGEVLQQYSHNSGEKIDFHLYTFEINPTYAQIATKMIQLAGLQEYVTVTVNTMNIDGLRTDLVDCLIDEIQKREHEITEMHSKSDKIEEVPTKIDFLLIDHDKDRYLSDLKLLEQSKFVQNHSMVVADNVLFANINDYIEYVQGLSASGIVSTKTIECQVEYSNTESGEGEGEGEDEKDDLKDGVELTIYLQDPCTVLSTTATKTIPES